MKNTWNRAVCPARVRTKNARAADVKSGGNRGSSGSCGGTSGEVPDAGLPEFSAGMTMQEIAECLHIPLSTVKTRMRKAKALLKERLEAIGYDG